MDSVAVYNDGADELVLFAVNKDLTEDIGLTMELRQFAGCELLEQMSAGLEELGADAARLRQALELWTGERADLSDGTLWTDIKSHGCKLFRLCP